MPFYYRGKTENRAPRSQAFMRVVTLTTLIAYPAGCALQVMAPDTTPEPGLTWGEAGGLALVVLSLLSFALITPSWLQRIVGEEKKRLDEFELDLRGRAYAFSYQVFAALTVLFAIYMALGVDLAESGRLSLWTPATYDHWNAIFWGAMLYAFILPTTWLAWAAPPPMGEDEDAAS